MKVVVKGDLLIRGGVESSIHCANAADQTDTEDEPRVRGHKAVRPSVGVQGARSQTDNTKTKASVHKSLIQEAPLVSGHCAILTGLTVEDEVGSQNGTTNDGSTVQQLLGEVTLRSIVGLLHVCPTEDILEGLAGRGEDGGRSCRWLWRLGSLKWRVVDEASSV